jgi:hypothetical protein
MIQHLTFDTYPVDLIVFTEETDEQIKKFLTDNALKELDDLYNFEEGDEAIFVYDKSYTYPTVYLRLRSTDYVGYIAHEALHVVAYIMRFIGCRFSKSSEEAYCYLLQAVMDKIYETGEE